MKEYQLRALPFFAGLAVMALTACQSGNESFVGCSRDTAPEDCIRVTPVPNLNARVATYTRTLNDLTDVPGTVFSQVPRSGSMRFTGVGGILIGGQIFRGTNGDPVIINEDGVLFGDANVTVNFADTVTGSITNFVGNYRGSLVSEYDGTIRLRNGRAGDGQRNAVAANYTGRLTGRNFDGTFNGALSGVVQGTPIRGVRLVEVDGTATINGRSEDTFVAIAGERQR